MKNAKLWATFNHLEFELPLEAIEDCAHQGECYEDCKYWQKKLALNLDRKKMIKELLEYGAWSNAELNELSNAELEIKLIWTAAWNIKESEEYNEKL